VTTPSRQRFLACLCVLAVLLAAVLPVPGGAPPAILPLTGPMVSVPVALGSVPGPGRAPAPGRFVPRGVPARAPPLA
jgi:hypothetical protein